MEKYNIQLSEVTDSDRFRIIELYRESTVLWCRESGGGRDKMVSAWNKITETISTPDRIFSVQLVQKIFKNLRDQYIRLLRRRCNSNWKFQSALQFLGTDPPPSNKTTKKSNGNGQLKVPKRQKLCQSITPISFVKVEEKPFIVEPLPIEQFIRPISNIEAPSSENSHASSSKTNEVNENKDSNIQLSDVTDADRLKIIELYKKKSELWNKGSSVPREKLAAAWEFITNEVSTEERRFSVPLVQKITKNLKDQYVRLLRRGAEHSNWKYLSLLSFLGNDHCHSHSIKKQCKSKFNAEKVESTESQSINNQESPLFTASNPIWSNLSLLSLTMPFIPLQTTTNTPIAPLTSENLASAQAEFFKKYPEQMCRNAMSSREAMIATWSLVVGAYMNSGRQ